MKKLLILIAALALIGLAVAACGPEPTPTPKPVSFKLWHAWTGAELDALNEVVAKFLAANPGAKIDLLAVPFDQLQNKFTTEASTGGGPDLMIGPKDWIGTLAQAKLIVALDDLSAQVGLDKLNKAAVDANKFGGKVWAFPESTEAVALWLNTDKVKTAPKDSDELLKLAADVGLGLNTGFYHSSGIIFGSGGVLFDSKQVCTLDQGTGAADALKFLATAKGTKNVVADSDGGKLDAAFKDGKVAMIFNGPWATGDYAKAIGAAKLAIADPIALKPSGKTFAPFLGTKNLFLSANAKGDSKEGALKFLNFLAQPETQALLIKAGHIPSNPNVKTDDKLVAGFIKQTQSASYFPNEPEMGAVWGPAGDMITKVLEGKAQAADAPKAACADINKANKK